MEGRRKDGVKKGTQQCPSMSKGSETGGEHVVFRQSMLHQMKVGNWFIPQLLVVVI
jgi:hypothetical protein